MARKYIDFPDWSKGMVIGASRIDLPPNVPWRIENIDLSIPLKPGLVPQDALLGVGAGGANFWPYPDHNSQAQVLFPTWNWHEIGDPFDRIFPISLFGTDFMFRRYLSAGDEKLYVALKSGSSWAEIVSTGLLDDPQPLGSNLFLPISGTSLIAWEPTTSTGLPVFGGGVYKIETTFHHEDPGSVGGGQGSTPYVSSGTDLFIGYRVVQVPADTYDVDVPGGILNDGQTEERIEYWLAVNSFTTSDSVDISASEFDTTVPPLAIDVLENPNHPCLDNWLFLGYSEGGDLFENGATAIAATSGRKMHLRLLDANQSWYGFTGGGTITLVSGSTAYTKDLTDVSGLVVERASDETAPQSYESLNYPVKLSDDDLITTYDDQTGDFGNPAWTIGSHDTEETQEGSTGKSPNVNIKPFRWYIPLDTTNPKKTWDDCPFNVPEGFPPRSLWEAGEEIQYYLVAEYGHGGFSVPVALGDPVQIWKGNTVDTAVRIQFFMAIKGTSLYWPIGIDRYHVFRATIGAAGKIFDDAWLFSADRENSSWLGGGTGYYTTGMLLSEEWSSGVATITDARGSGALSQDNAYSALLDASYLTNTVRYPFVNLEMVHSGIGTALANYIENLAYLCARGAIHEKWRNSHSKSIDPFSKAGIGYHSFVDWGQSRGGDTSRTVLGITLDELMNDAIDVNDLVPIGSSLGRMFYRLGTGERTLIYYSLVDQPTIVPPTNRISMGDTGEAIGISNVHGFIMFFFRRKLVIVDARQGLDQSWSIMGEYEGAGCVSKDTIAKLRGTTMWVGGEHIWRWDGTEKDPYIASEYFDYPGFGKDIETASDYMWGFMDPVRGDYLLYFPHSSSYTALGQEVFNSLWGDEARLVVYHLADGKFSTETLRSFVQANDSQTYETLKYAGNPIFLENMTLIPVGANSTHSGFYYMAARQDYTKLTADHDFTDADTLATPLWKLPVVELGILDLGSSITEKALKRLHAAFSGGDFGGWDAPTLDTEWLALDHWKIDIWRYNREVHADQATGGEATLPEGSEDLETHRATADWTYDFKTHLYGDGAAEETSTWRQDKASIFEIPIFGQRGRFFGIRLIGGIWDAVTYDAGYTVAPFEIGKLGLSYEIEEGI